MTPSAVAAVPTSSAAMPMTATSYGGNGNDVLNGGAGTDRLYGEEEERI